MNTSVGASLPSSDDLAHIYVLDSLKGFGPQKFKWLYELKVPPKEVVRRPAILADLGKRGEPIRKQLEETGQTLVETCRSRADKQLETALRLKALILTYGSQLYPRNVFQSNNPVPALYVRGDVEALRSNWTVACVGSRKIREPYIQLHSQFAATACEQGLTLVSGFALGADTVGHKTAFESGGSTICVMPSGLDRPFPPENKSVWHQFLEGSRAVFVSEFPFGIGAASLNLRKRNKLIVACSRGVLISQSSSDGGAMNAYRFAVEQKKPIATFRDDGSKETSGNRQISQENNRTFVGGDRGAFCQWLLELSSST